MSGRRDRLQIRVAGAEARWQKLGVLLGKLRSSRDLETRTLDQMRIDAEITEAAASQAAVEAELDALEKELAAITAPSAAPVQAKPARRLDLFFCYAREDEPLLDELRTHLALLFRSGASGWDDRAVRPGEEAAPAVAAQIDAARVIVLLVSADFLASDRIHEEELPRAMRRQAAGEAIVVPIIVRACDWSPVSFAGLRVLPKDGVPVAQWPDRDAVLADIARNLRALVSAH